MNGAEVVQAGANPELFTEANLKVEQLAAELSAKYGAKPALDMMQWALNIQYAGWGAAKGADAVMRSVEKAYSPNGS